MLTYEQLCDGLVKLHNVPPDTKSNTRYCTRITEDDDIYVVRWVPTGAIYIANKHDCTVGGYFYSVKTLPVD